jgi:hypothetical protein
MKISILVRLCDFQGLSDAFRARFHRCGLSVRFRHCVFRRANQNKLLSSVFYNQISFPAIVSKAHLITIGKLLYPQMNFVIIECDMRQSSCRR